MDRRSFITSTTAAAISTTMMPINLFGGTLPAGIEIALSQYSLRAMLKDGSLQSLDFPQFTADTFGIKAIDLWEGGLPKDKLNDAKYMDEMKKRCEKAGTDLFLFMAPALDCHPKRYAKSKPRIMASLKRASMLECKLLRVFIKAPGQDVAAGVQACVEGLKPIADEAGKAGITVAIEPGSSALSSKGSFVAEVGKTINHEHVKLMPDFGKLKNNVYDGTQAMLTQTISVSCKMHSFDDAGKQPDFDYPRLMKMILDSGYKGYMAIEWEGKKLQPVAGVKASKKLILDSIKAVSA